MLVLTCICNLTSTGTIAAQSANNFKFWVESIFLRYNNDECLVRKQDATVMQGLYHKMPKERLSAVEGYFTTLSRFCSEAVAAGVSGGAYFDVQPGGKGTLTMTHKMVGPFQ